MQVYGSDYIEFDKAIQRGMELIETGDNPTLGLLIVCGVNFGLRISDLLTIDFTQLKSGEFVVVEKKTKKKRKIITNSYVCNALEHFRGKLPYEEGQKAFKSQKGTVYSIQQVNRLLKKQFSREGLLITTHSLRKTFGRRIYNKMGKSEALAKLQIMFNHSSPATTLRYIGVQQEELDDMFAVL